ncbi:hypothetical protein Y032_0223g2654 [Ancylostoma ceylanicum]|nr:hypothetical protein Y032_0223g2654 [Ancylostoma ceylanicum]
MWQFYSSPRRRKFMKPAITRRLFPVIDPTINRCRLLPPFIRFREVYLISQRYNLATCQIEKIMSTFRYGMFCYLNRHARFEASGRNISTEHWMNTFCFDNRFKKEVYEDVIHTFTKNPVIFAVIRDPLERFVSSYVDKCIREGGYPRGCYDCERDLLCFMQNLKKFLLAYIDDPLIGIEHIYIRRHFAPFSWYCNFGETLNTTHIVRLNLQQRGDVARHINEILMKAGVQYRQRNYIQEELLKRLPNHSTNGAEERSEVERSVLSDPIIFQHFIDIYYYDYVIFGYKLPQISRIKPEKERH